MQIKKKISTKINSLDMIKFNLVNRTKRPVKKNWQNLNKPEKISRNNNYGILAGKKNNIIILDLDCNKWNTPEDKNNILKNECEAMVGKNKHPFLLKYPNIEHINTYTIKTPNGYHLYFKYNEKFSRKTVNSKYQIDILSNKSFAVGPGSIGVMKDKFGNPTNKKLEYKIINNCEIKEMTSELSNFLLQELDIYNFRKYRNTVNSINKKHSKVYNNQDIKFNFDIMNDTNFNNIISKIPNNNWKSYSEWFKLGVCFAYFNKIELFDKLSKQYGKDCYNKNKNNFEYQKMLKINNKENYVKGLINKFCPEILGYFQYKYVDLINKKPDKIINKNKLCNGINFIKEELSKKCLIVKSDTGTGKTYALCKFLRQSKFNFISLVSRVCLAYKHQSDFEEQDIETLIYKEDDFSEAQNKNIISTPESILTKVKNNCINLKNYILILDEFNSFLWHLWTSPTIKNRVETIKYIIEIFQNCKYIICVDADISNVCFSFLDEININYKYIKNEYKSNKDIKMFEITSQEQLINKLKQESKYILCLDSLKNSKDIVKLLDDKNVKIFSSETDNGNPNLDIYDKIIITPAILYGIDSQLKRPVYAFYQEHTIHGQNMCQQISRCRNITKLFFCFLDKKPKRARFENYKESINDCLIKNELSIKQFGELASKKLQKIYITILSHINYVNDCFNTNKAAWFINLNINRGFILDREIILKSTEKPNNKKLRNEIKQEIIEAFTMENPIYKKINKILKIPEENIEEYKEFLIDEHIREKHFIMSKLYFKETEELEDKLKFIGNFNIETYTSIDNKLIFTKELINKYNIDINNLESEQVPTQKESKNIICKYKEIFNVYKRNKVIDSLNLNNKKDFYKFVTDIFKKLVDSKLYNKKQIRKNKIRQTKYKLNKEFFEINKSLYYFRNPVKVDNDFIHFLDYNL